VKILIVFALALAAVRAESVAGIRWIAPPAWKNEGARPMRVASYAVPKAPGDQEPGECVAYYFGPSQGGSVDANVLRWKGQFLGSDGQVSKSSKVSERTVNGLKVTLMDISGEYTGMGGPMAQNATKMPGYRLLGAIAQAPEGLVFFKFTGPAKTVQANEAAFQKMIASLARK
jgi:hypothetical protein